MTHPPIHSALALSGGGYRTIWQLKVLSALSKQLDLPVQHLFKLAAGTSGGAIIACALAEGMSPEEIQELYFQCLPQIFAKVDGWKVKSIFGLDLPRYQGDGLEEELEIFLPSTSKQVELPVITVAWDSYNRQVVLFDTRDEHTFYLADAARASASAPTYFPGLRRPHSGFFKGGFQGPDKRVLIDGGFGANYPGQEVETEMIKSGVNTSREGVLIEIGSGVGSFRDDTTWWGLKKWILYDKRTMILDQTFEMGRQLRAYRLDRIMGERYVHFNFELPRHLSPMDAHQHAGELLDQPIDAATLDRACEMLTKYGNLTRLAA